LATSLINFEHYKVFYHVATKLSFSQAAQCLYLSQSAVSQTIRLLEEQLGVSLFIRTTKQVRLTQSGQLLFHHIEQAYHLIEMGERTLADLHGLQRGELRLGASDTICRYYLISFLTQYKQLYPSIKITLVNRPSPICVDLLKKGVLDIAIVTIAGDFDEPNLSYQPLLAISDILIAGSAYAFLQTKPLPLPDVKHYPLILLEKGSATRHYIDDFFATQQLTIDPAMNLGSLDLCLDLVKENMGLSFAIKEFIPQELATLELFEVTLATMPPKRQLGLVTHTKLPLPIAAQKFYELLEKKPPQ
jgi:DNA-binding transcriptional LysR family regulator